MKDELIKTLFVVIHNSISYNRLNCEYIFFKPLVLTHNLQSTTEHIYLPHALSVWTEAICWSLTTSQKRRN